MLFRRHRDYCFWTEYSATHKQLICYSYDVILKALKVNYQLFVGLCSSASEKQAEILPEIVEDAFFKKIHWHDKEFTPEKYKSIKKVCFSFAYNSASS